jgi:hypothetical protein
MDELEKILDVPFTFSANCRSGLLARCECRRCRKTRGEPVTEETEALAKAQAKVADEEQSKKMSAFLAEWRNKTETGDEHEQGD